MLRIIHSPTFNTCSIGTHQHRTDVQTHSPSSVFRKTGVLLDLGALESCGGGGGGGGGGGLGERGV